MARIDNLFDSTRGSIANLVFYRMNGCNYVRSKPGSYTDRKSPAQLAQRQRLKVTNEFLKPFRALLRISFCAEAVGRTALQAAQSYNMRNALVGEYPDIAVDPGRALLSKGPLPLPLNAVVSAHPEGLLIQWENGSEGASNDSLVVMARLTATAWSDYRFTNTLRHKGEYLWKTTLPVPEGDLPDVWIAFRNSRMTHISNSMYISFEK